MKYTNDDLVGMDYQFFFRRGNEIVSICTNGFEHPKFLVDGEHQDQLYDYLMALPNQSEYQIHKEYPIMTHFTSVAEKGIWVYDMQEGKEVLVATPTTLLLVSELPLELQKLLTKF